MTPESVIIRDALRLADAEVSIDIWEKIKSGQIIFPDSKYDPDERIAYYTQKKAKYFERVKKHGESKALKLLSEVLPAWVIVILKKIFDIL